MASLFSNPHLLEEHSAEKDLVGYGSEVKRIGKYLLKILELRNSAVIALLGPFGSGKTSALNRIQKTENLEGLWFRFEIWKYPDRGQIWDNFVIELVAYLRGKNRREK